MLGAIEIEKGRTVPFPESLQSAVRQETAAGARQKGCQGETLELNLSQHTSCLAVIVARNDAIGLKYNLIFS